MLFISVIITHILHITNLIDETASRSIWIAREIFFAPRRIRTHQGRVMQLMQQALYLQATTALAWTCIAKEGNYLFLGMSWAWAQTHTDTAVTAV